MSLLARRLLGVTALIWALTLVVAVGAANAAESTYPESPEARSFATGQAGWTETSSFEGLCLPPLLCPSVANSRQPTGGAADDGFIRSTFFGVLGVGGTVRAVWQSPTFTYHGAGGDEPASVEFTLSRRSNVSQLLASSTDSVTYSVDLIDLTAGSTAIPLVSDAPLAGPDDWTAVAPLAVDPASLDLGDDYAIRITSTYVTSGSLVVTGSADYDDVALRAARDEEQDPTEDPGTGDPGAGDPEQGGGSPGGGGSENPSGEAGGTSGKPSDGASSGGGASSGPGGSSGGLTRKQALTILERQSPRTAAHDGKRLFVRVNCPAIMEQACRVRLQGFRGRRRRVTRTRAVKVGKGKRREVALPVLRGQRKRVRRLKRILIREQVRSGRLRVRYWAARRLVPRR